jgi:hypothetical protein
MADQVMTGDVELSALRPELWSAAFYPTLKESLPWNDVVARDYEGDIQALGDIVNITTFPQFDAALDIAEDEKVDASAITAANSQLVVNHQLVKDFIVTDRAKVQTIEHANAVRDLAFFSIMKGMQSQLIADTVPSAASPDHTISYASGTTLALADILAAKELLDEQNVEDDGTRCMILGSEQWNDLFNITGFTSRDFTPIGSPLAEGGFSAKVLGFSPKLTTEAGATSYFFHPLYMELAVQRSLSVKVFDQGVEGKRS